MLTILIDVRKFSHLAEVYILDSTDPAASLIMYRNSLDLG